MTDVVDDGPGNFVEDLVREDLETGRVKDLVTRFPPEPNGYLHIGHAKAICLNFGLAETFGGRCNLRFDDTNPTTEDTEYVEGIQEDIRWLGFEWGEKALFASDYFDQLYAWAQKLVQEGRAYVDSQTEDEIRENRGDFHRPGVNSPHRDRGAEENLDLLARMKAGEFPDGAHVLRAKIDMQSTDLKLRDPLMYRIRHATHHRTGDTWSIYPMYDWAHGQSDAIEGVSHSVCSLEFVNHRPLYDWFKTAIEADPAPQQIEFARLNLDYTVMSKRKLRQLVEEGHVDGWDDPRMPTLRGMRRRGITPAAIRAFSDRIGVSTRNSFVDISLLEHAIREDLNRTSPRVMAVLNPLKVVIENFEEGRVEEVQARFDPEDESKGSRPVPLTREIWVERDDFMKEAPKKWWRLAPGKEVRLRYGALVTCHDVVEVDGEVRELRCRWDPESLGGNAPDGRKVRGTIHWVSAVDPFEAEVRLYDRLFKVENPLSDKLDGDFLDYLNEASLEVRTGCKLERSLRDRKPGERVQFERLGYFCVDGSSTANAPVFNRTIALRDSWAKKAKKG
ncbi:MAG: glutamine--tRNA ligase/YqeY domain fusion protein [Myxococcota bacterium]